MKRFLLTMNGFILLIVGVTLVMAGVSYQTVQSKARFKFNKRIDYIMAGHSHPECAYNDTLIRDFKNVASSGEPYFYTYPKIQNIINQNPDLNVIFIEFSNNQITKRVDSWIWSDEQLSNQFPVVAPFVTADGHLLLYKNNRSGYLHSLSVTLRKQLLRIATSNFDFLPKGYLSLDHELVDSPLNVSPPIDNTAEYSLVYLEKIIQLCQKSNKKVYLVRSPQHVKYVERENEIQFQEILKTKFKRIEFLDFNDFPLQNWEFADYGHLNARGAKRFSLWFDQLLRDGLLEKKEKQAYIGKRMVM